MGWAALIPLAVSAYSAISGAVNKNKAQKERERLAENRPELGDSQYVETLQDLASSELARGQNTPARIAMRQASDSNFSSALQSLLQSGGGAGNVADLYGQAQIGQMRMAMDGDALRQNQIRNLFAANQGSEQFRQQQFQVNRWAPWADDAQAAAASIQSANNQMMSGISSFGSGLGNWVGSMENAAAYNNYFKPPKEKQSTWGNLGNQYGKASMWGME